jgi:hypothetical protein
LLDVKNRVRDLPLRKNNLILPIFRYRFSLAHLGEKYFGIKRGFNSLPHKGFPFLARAALSPDEGRARRGDYSDSPEQMKIRLVRPLVSVVGNLGNSTPGGILPSHNTR